MCWSPDGKFVSAGGADGRVYVWDVNEAAVKAVLKGHESAGVAGVNACVWGQGGLISADKRGAVTLWE